MTKETSDAVKRSSKQPTGNTAWNKGKTYRNDNFAKKYTFIHNEYGEIENSSIRRIIELFPELKLNHAGFKYVLNHKTKSGEYKGWSIQNSSL